MLSFRGDGWRRWLVLAALYFLVASLTIATTRFGGGVSVMWAANSLAIAHLLTTPRRRWRAALTASAAGSTLATGLFGFGWVAAAPFAAANLLEAAVTVLLFRRIAGHLSPLESVRGFAAFALAAGMLAPALGALCGGALATLHGQAFLPSAFNWLAGHALGALTFTPLALLFLRGDVRGWAELAGIGQRLEAFGLLAAVFAISLLVFSQQQMPLLFLPLFPIMVATFRTGRFGAATSVIILSLVGITATLEGSGPMALLAASPETKLQFLQFYLAVTVLTVLPAAAELNWRKQLFSRLQESEARYRLLAEYSTDIIFNIDPDGRISFASPAIATVGGYQPREVIGRPALALVDAEDAAKVQAAHARALAEPGRTEKVEYRGVMADGSRAWMETQTQGYFDAEGRALGVVSAVRNIEQRKALEKRLAVEADTDGLTGACNRRAFMRALEAAAKAQRQAERGCLAIFDIDHFKLVNDRFGHPEGDRVLREFVKVARQTVREQDVIGRIGGEEFAVLLKGADRWQAEAVCQRLRSNFAAALRKDGQPPLATVSAGVAALAEGREAAEALRLADEALYRAKRAGRDRLELAA